MSFDDTLKMIDDQKKLSIESKHIFKVLVELLKSITNERDSKIYEIQQKLDENISQNNSCLAAKDEEISRLSLELQTATLSNKSLTAQLNKMKNVHDDLEAYGRRESLIFSGDKVKPFTADENCCNIARDIIRDTLKLQIDPLISTAHRIGKPSARDSSAADKRGIIVKFVRRDDKFMILKKARDKHSRVKGLDVNESLTPTRAKIKNVLLQCKKMRSSPVTGVFTHNCKVFVYTKSATNAPDNAQSIKQEINTEEKLAEFCLNFIKKPLETFLDLRGNKIF